MFWYFITGVIVTLFGLFAYTRYRKAKRSAGSGTAGSPAKRDAMQNDVTGNDP